MPAGRILDGTIQGYLEDVIVLRARSPWETVHAGFSRIFSVITILDYASFYFSWSNSGAHKCERTAEKTLIFLVLSFDNRTYY